MSRYVKVKHMEFVNAELVRKVKGFDITQDEHNGTPSVYGVRLYYEGPNRPEHNAFDVYEDFIYTDQYERNKVIWDMTEGKIA